MQATGSTRKQTEMTKGTGTAARSNPNEVRQAGFPSREEIARRAYEIFMARGGHHGRHEEDWYQAMRELQSRQ